MNTRPLRSMALGLLLLGLACSLGGGGELVTEPPGPPPVPIEPTPDATPTDDDIPAPSPTSPLPDLDYGDAVDPTFPSLRASDGARAGVGTFWLGEPEAPPSAEGDAKIVDADDWDDGLTRLLMVPGKALVTFQATLHAAAQPTTVYFNLLADVNRDLRWGSFSGPTGSVREWIVENRKLALQPGERQEIETEFPLGQGVGDLWFRATLSERPVESPDWDGSGAFVEGEVEDYHLPPALGADWNYDCEPDPLVLFHGETGSIFFALKSGAGGPDTFQVTSTLGPMGLFGDPLAEEIDVIQIPPPVPPTGGPSDFPGTVDVTSLDVHGPDHVKSYEIVVRLKGVGRVETEKCIVDVWHWEHDRWFVVQKDRVVYTGPTQVQSGGTLEAAFMVFDASGKPAQGVLFSTLGDPPGDKLASHANGRLDAGGRITLRLLVNWPAGKTKLYFSWRDEVHPIAEIEVLP